MCLVQYCSVALAPALAREPLDKHLKQAGSTRLSGYLATVITQPG